jgi:hypothetical protein
MPRRVVTDQEQIDAIIRGQLPQLFEEEGPEAAFVIRDYVTLPKAALADYLDTHPEIAESCFRERSKVRPLHESIVTGQSDRGYWVGISDHGTVRFAETFDSIGKALAQALFWENGLP